jgi:hypothetical protein
MSKVLWFCGVFALILGLQAAGFSFSSQAGAPAVPAVTSVDRARGPVAATELAAGGPAAAATPVSAPADGGLCGGKVCTADQFCCGPPACGHCAYRMAGPVCPTACP